MSPLRHLVPLLSFASVLLGAASLRAQAPREDDRPVVDDSKAKVVAAANAALPTLYIVGDSTARSGAPLRGWGDELAPFFGPAKINVVNRAIGGRSSRTFIAEGRWDKVCAELKAGDYVIVQFGHNDGGALDERGKFRGSIKGLGGETQEIVKPDGKTETVHSYGWYLTKFVTDAKAKGAHPILASPVPHKKWQGDFAEYRKWSAAVAKANGVPFLDVTVITGATYEKLGAAKVDKLFGDARTHTNVDGARINAESVVAGIKALPNSPLAGFLSGAGKAVPAASAQMVAAN